MLSAACYAIRLMVHISNINPLKSIYYAHFHSIIKHGKILGGNSSNSGKIFTLQKKIVRILAGAQPSASYRSLFKQLEIIPVLCQSILSFMNCIIKNQENFQTNSSMHNINRRKKHNLHRPNASLSCFPKSALYAGIKILNNIPPGLTILQNSFIHWRVQNSMIPCHSQELLPFVSIMYFFLPPFSTDYSSILSHLVLPSISWPTSQTCLFPNSYLVLFLEFYFLPFSEHVQTNIIYLTLLSLL